MKLKYYLRGMGIGMIITAIVMGIALNGRKETLSDAEIMARARELGMIDSTVLSDYAAQGAMGDALGGAGDQGNAADGSAGVSVRSVTQSGEAASHRVVFEKIDPVEQTPSTDAGTGALNTEKTDAANDTMSADASEADTAKKADAAAADTARKADAAAADTAKKADAAAADTAKKADAAAADTAKKADAAAADTAKKADAAAADTAKKADAAAADTAKKTDAAVADTSKKEDTTAADTAKKADAATEDTAKKADEAVADTAVTADAGNTGNTVRPAAAGAVKTVVIPGGVGSETVARILADAGLVDSAASYDKYLCEAKVDRMIRSGTMSIPEGATWEQIKDIITR